MSSRFEITDELWAETEPLILVRERRRRYLGCKAIDDGLALSEIWHVLHTGSRGRICRANTSTAPGDLLATVAYLAEGRRVGCPSPEAAREAERRRRSTGSRVAVDASHICALWRLLTGPSLVD